MSVWRYQDWSCIIEQPGQGDTKFELNETGNGCDIVGE